MDFFNSPSDPFNFPFNFPKTKEMREKSMLFNCFDVKCEFRQIGFYRVAGILLIDLCVLSANA